MNSLLMCETKALPNLYLGGAWSENDIGACMTGTFGLPVCVIRAGPHPNPGGGEGKCFKI